VAVVSPLGGTIAAAVLPPLGAVAGTAIVASSILDPADATVAVFSTAAFGTVFGGLMLLSGVGSIDDAVDGERVLQSASLLAAGGVAVLGLIAATVVPTTLVVLDEPE